MLPTFANQLQLQRLKNSEKSFLKKGESYIILLPTCKHMVDLVPEITGWTLLRTMVTPRRYASLETAACISLLLV